MTQPPSNDHSAVLPDLDPLARERDAELQRHGVVQVPIISYEWGGFRYSIASDALAAAKRAAK